MVVDRGGVRYPMEVVDRVSDPLIRIRSQLRLTRQEFRRLRAEAAKGGVGGPVGPTGPGRQGSQFRSAAQQASATNAQVRAQKKLADQVRQTAKAQNQATTAAVRGSRRVVVGLNRATRAGDRLLATVKRLLGAFVLFQAARAGAGAFSDLIKSGFAFNQTVEQSRIGIAGILVSVAKLRDEQGNVLRGAEAFTAAQIIAGKAQNDLLADAQLTTATYEELLLVFQRALGPGIAAGLEVDQVRELSVLISQAATAIGLAQNQLDEEIRALFTGNIRTNTTRLAQIVGLTNEDIRETSDLFGLLRTRLIGFRLAADESANTIAGLARRIQGALQIVAGGAAVDAFENLRGLLRGVFDALVQVERGADGAISAVTPNPQAQAAFGAIFASVNRLLTVVRQLGSEVGFAGLEVGANALAQAIDFVGRAAIFVFQAFGGSITTVRTLLEPFVGILTEVRDTLDEIFGTGATESFALSLATGLATLITIKSVLGGIGSLWAFIFAQTFGTAKNLARLLRSTALWAVQVTSAGAAWKRTLASVTLIGGAIFGLAVATKSLTEQILGVSLSWEDMLEIAASTIEQVFSKVTGLASVVAEGISSAIGEALLRSGNFIADLLAEANRQLDVFRGDESIQQNEIEREQAALQRAQNLARFQQNAELKLAELKKENARISKDADDRAAKAIANIRKRNEAPVAPIPVAPNGNAPNLGPEAPPGAGLPPRFRGTVEPANPRELQQSGRQNNVDAARLAQVRLAAETRISQIKAQQLGSDAERQAILASNLIKAQDELAVATKRASIEKLSADLRKLNEQGQGESERALQIETQILTIKQKQAQVAELQAQSNRDQAGALMGLALGVRNFGQSIGTAFQAGFDIATESMRAFSNTVSGLITTALDPTSDGDSVRQQFADLFGSIRDIIIKNLTDQAIAAAIAFILKALGSSSTQDTASANGIVSLTAGLTRGGFTGGPIPNSAAPGLAHARARGYASGGRITGSAAPLRPRGLHPSDKTPIWAAAGEHMMPLSAVAKYGRQFMTDIQHGALDPGVVSSLSASTGAAKTVTSTTGSGGFASGGAIPRAVASPVARAVSSPGRSRFGSSPAPAIVVSSPQAARRLTDAKVFRENMRDNKDVIQ